MIAAFAAALLALTAAPALAQVREVEQSGRWTHAATGTEFAERVAGFDRVSITEYTATGGTRARATGCGATMAGRW